MEHQYPLFHMEHQYPFWAQCLESHEFEWRRCMSFSQVCCAAVVQGKDGKARFGALSVVSQRSGAQGIHQDWARYQLELDLDQNPNPVTVRGADGKLVSGSRYRLKVSQRPTNHGPCVRIGVMGICSGRDVLQDLLD